MNRILAHIVYRLPHRLEVRFSKPISADAVWASRIDPDTGEFSTAWIAAETARLNADSPSYMATYPSLPRIVDEKVIETGRRMGLSDDMMRLLRRSAELHRKLYPQTLAAMKAGREFARRTTKGSVVPV